MMISFILHTGQFTLPLPYHAIQKYNLLFTHIRGVITMSDILHIFRAKNGFQNNPHSDPSNE